MNSFRGNGRITKSTLSTQDKSCPERTGGPHSDGRITRWVPFSSQNGELIQQVSAYLGPSRESTPRGQGWKSTQEHSGSSLLQRNLSAPQFWASNTKPAEEQNSSSDQEQSKSYLCGRVNIDRQCQIETWHLRLFFDLWRLTPHQRSLAISKREGSGGAGTEDEATVVWLLVPTLQFSVMYSHTLQPWLLVRGTCFSPPSHGTWPCSMLRQEAWTAPTWSPSWAPVIYYEQNNLTAATL